MGYMCVFFYLKQCVCEVFLAGMQEFHIIPDGFCYLPGEKFTARFHPGKIFKI